MNWWNGLTQDNKVKIAMVFIVAVLSGIGYILKSGIGFNPLSTCTRNFKPLDYQLYTYSARPADLYINMENDVVQKFQALGYKVIPNNISYNDFPSNARPG